MPLTRGRTLGYNASRMTFDFTMMDDKANLVGCEISSAAMDQLAGTRGTLPAKREAQFLQLRDGIECIASDLFDEVPTSGGKVRVFYHHVRFRELPYPMRNS
jgi:hypothetical protein